MQLVARFRVAVLVCAVSATWFAVGATPATATPTWAPAATATVHPGVQTFTAGAQCTSNFVFFDATDVYLGQAAHCSGTGAATETNGCEAESLPLGTPVEISGASQPGVMVYNSWIAMQQAGETDPDTCAYNDLALIRIDPSDAASVNPSIPFWGGPSGLEDSSAQVGSSVYSYGNSSIRFGLSPLSPKQGVIASQAGGGWSHTVLTFTPGVPGDSGSAFLDANGLALGVLSTLQVLPTPGGNGVGDLSRELDYLASHSSLNVELASGTEPFNPSGAAASLLGVLGGL